MVMEVVILIIVTRELVEAGDFIPMVEVHQSGDINMDTDLFKVVQEDTLEEVLVMVMVDLVVVVEPTTVILVEDLVEVTLEVVLHTMEMDILAVAEDHTI